MSPIDHVTLIGHSALFRKSDPADPLALKRADNAAEYLLKLLRNRSLNHVQIITGGVGTYEPRTTNSTRTGRKLNRRVEVFLRSKRSFKSQQESMKLYCSDAKRPYHIKTFQTQTCHSDNEAAQICAANVKLTGRKHIIGAVCLPLYTSCVIC